MDHERRSNRVDQQASEMSLRAGLALSGLSHDQLWLRCLAVGGTFSCDEFEAALSGRRWLTTYEHDVIAQALNDYFVERGQNHPVAYADELTPDERGR
jgi:hypothetical protein